MLALIVKAVDAINGRTLVISAQDEEILGIFDLEREEKTNRLETLLAAVNVVAKEQIDNWRPGVDPPYSNSRKRS